MFEKCLIEAESVLRTQKEPYVSVSIVWEEVVQRGQSKGFDVVSLSDFTALLEGDNRFQILPGKTTDDEGFNDEDSLEDPEMEQMGFFPEDRVGLRTSKKNNQENSDDDEDISSIRVRGIVSGKEKPYTAQTEKKEKSLGKQSVAKKKSVPKKKGSVKKLKPAKKKCQLAKSANWSCRDRK